MSLSVHIDNKGKDILIIREGPTQGLDDNTLTAEAKCSIYFTQVYSTLISLAEFKFALSSIEKVLINALINFVFLIGFQWECFLCSGLFH